MKSIRDTLEIIRDITNALPDKINIALTGGYAVILHGVERTTIDVDFCIYSDLLDSSGSKAFIDLLNKHIPKRFSTELRQGSKIPDDPFKHDLIRIVDTQQEYFTIDLLIARYKWELDALNETESFKDIPIPVLNKPYLVAMKLQATGYKDYHDIVSLMDIMSDDEKAKARELAKRTGKDKKLERLLSPPPDEEVRENPEEYIS
jgi:hypothetical protein